MIKQVAVAVVEVAEVAAEVAAEVVVAAEAAAV